MKEIDEQCVLGLVEIKNVFSAKGERGLLGFLFFVVVVLFFGFCLFVFRFVLKREKVRFNSNADSKSTKNVHDACEIINF